MAVAQSTRRALLARALFGAAGAASVALLAACGAGGAVSATGSSSSAGAASAAAPVAASSASSAASSSTSASAAASTSAASAATATATSAATTASAAASAPAKPAGNVVLNFYSNGDTNIHDLWNTDLLPKWNGANPAIQIKLTFSEHGTDNSAIQDKLAGAKAAGKPSGVDIAEGLDFQTGGQQGLFVPLTAAAIPSLAKCDPNVIKQQSGYGLPYRASSVVLAYNSQFVTSPPQSLDDIYTWIKANSGKFAYNPPDKGGSGSAFVTATLKKFLPANQLDTFQTGYDASLESAWNQGFDLLHGLAPNLLRGGFYPAGNVPVLQELGKQTIYVAPVWSDQGLSYLSQKLLPDTVKLQQINPPFNGGASYLGVPTGGQYADQAYQFLDWVLQPDQQAVVISQINGYPGLEWQYMPDAVRQKFAALAKNYDTFAFSSKFSADVNKLWYEKVAGTPPPKS